MSYRHAYHAGNAADVFKHIILTLILKHLRRKPAPFCILDAHAGTGRYDLASEPSTRTPEFEEGIVRLLSLPPDRLPDIQDYLGIIRSLNDDAPALPRVYPGSPWLARGLLRDHDRLVACELHADDAATLKRTFAGDRQVAVHHMDGYQAIKAHLPPRENRGLVIVDPPYERTKLNWSSTPLAEGSGGGAADSLPVLVSDQGARLRCGPDTGLRGPVIKRDAQRCHGLSAMARDRQARRMGMIIANPPWRLDGVLKRTLPSVTSALYGADVTWRVDRLQADLASA